MNHFLIHRRFCVDAREIRPSPALRVVDLRSLKTITEWSANPDVA